MKCNEFKEKMYDYLLEDVQPQDFEKHLANCSDCSAEFEQLQQFVHTLKPKLKARASHNFTNNIIKKLKKEDQKMKKRVPFYLKVAAILVLIATSLFIVLYTSSSYQASAAPVNRVLTDAAKALSKLKTMQLEMEVRTIAHDNFEMIGTEYDFVKNVIKVDFSSPKKWLIEKAGRKVLCDGKNQYLDIETMDYVMQGNVNAGFVVWFQIFLKPDKILETEKETAKKEKSKYDLQETENQFILTVLQDAQGDFTNDYSLNSTVSESNNKRIFYFDKDSKQLLGFELYILENGQETLVMKTTEIKYNETFDEQVFSVNIFGNKIIKYAKDLEQEVYKELQDKTPEEIARFFFDGCSKKDWDNVKKVCSYLNANIKNIYGELEIIEIGKSFKSGQYAGVFVPYTVKLKSGKIKKFNIAIRNDNPQKMWVVDGGI